MKWISTTSLLLTLGLAWTASEAPAQQAATAESFDAFSARLEQQDRQFQQLQAQLWGVQQAVYAAPAADGPAGGMAAPAAGQPAAQPGSEMSVKASFKDGSFLWFETPNKDFSMHLGGWAQYDNVWWGESLALKAPKGGNAGSAQGVASGDATGGIGDLQDGTYFRRIRIFAEGTFWGSGEYRLIPALENNQYGTVGLDEFWFGGKDIPLIGTVRLGHIKTPLGLEGDMTGSSRAMTFMERSAYSESIELNQNFITGIWFSNNCLDQRLTWSAAAFRTDLKSSTGAFFGDNQYGLQARVTALPLYEEEGRHLLHLGLSGGWRSGSNNIANNPWNTVDLSSRPEMRDDDPARGAGLTPSLPNADSNAMLDTGNIACGDELLAGLELLYIRGPLSLQGEYGWNRLNGAVGILNPAATATTFGPALAPAQDYLFSGGYFQLACTLTGETRAYDKPGGTLAREYFGKSGPYSPARLTRDADGNIISSSGAWEVAARFSYVDLNSGNGTKAIQGGIMDGVSLGLNWYLNTNFNVMFDYVYDYRYDVPVGSPAAAGTAVGATQGIGCEVQFQY